MSKLSLWKTIFFLWVFCAVQAIGSRAQTFTTPLVNFNHTDGAAPESAPLVQGLDGNLYGVTSAGGANYSFDYCDSYDFTCGTLFRMTPTGELTTLYDFCTKTNCADGSVPNGLLQATDGNLYGTTDSGGSNNNCNFHGCGTIFEITLGGSFTPLYSFCTQTNCADGYSPFGGLVQASDGNFYGTTQAGGASSACGSSGCGTIFKMTPGSTPTKLYNFCSQPGCTDGADPTGLVQANDGNLYGATYSGGTYGLGTVFEITTGGAFTPIYSCTGQGDCEHPYGTLVQATDGNLYGMNFQGAVSKITLGGTVTVLAVASGYIYQGLLQATDGNLYGTTYTGGANGSNCTDGCGSLFEITLAGTPTLTTLYSFCFQPDCSDGSSPLAALMQATNGTLYGTTSTGGADGDGTVFSLGLGLGPFVKALPTLGKVGTAVIILGYGLTGATSVTFNGTAATFTVVSDTEITTTVPPGATTGTVQVTMPSGALNSNVPFQVLLLPIASVTPAALTFSGQNVGTTSGSQSVTVRNTGNAPLTFTSIVASTNFGETDNCSGGVTAGSSCTINVTFSPTAIGPLTGTLTITDNNNAMTGSVQTVSLSGTGTTPAAGVSPLGLTFGSQSEGTTSASQPVTLSNTGTGALTITSIATSSNFSETNNCGTSVAPSGSCTINVTFSPKATGPLTGILTITDNANGVAGSMQTVSLSGTGTVPVAGVSPPSLTFGSQSKETTSASQPVTLTNTGNGTLTVTSIATSSNFGETNNCGSGVAPSGSCTINVTFSPTVTGPLAGTLTISDNANGVAGSMQTVSLSGTGTAPVAGVSPPSLTFGSQNLGTTSASQSVTVSNTGTAALTITGVVASSNFGESNNCGGSVAPSSSCTINVTFSPTADGPLTGTLTITDNNNGVAGSMQTVSLSGTGVSPGASVSPASVSFGTEVISATSSAKKVTLTSTGTANLNISSIAITGANASDFAESNNCPARVALAAKCTISLTYTPSVLGAETATLTVADNAPGSPQTVALSGTGEQPVVLSPSSLSFGNVGENSPSASKNITLTNHQGVSLNISGITLSNPDYRETDNCVGSVAAKGTCTISVTLTPSMLGAETATLSVTDNASNDPQTAALTGTGVLPATLSAAALDFGKVPQSIASASKNITLSNAEDVALTVASITTGNPDFTETDNCVGSLPAKGKCTITITFTPGIIGVERGMLTVNDTASNGPQTATLSGTGIAQVVVSPASLTWVLRSKGGSDGAIKSVTLINNLPTRLPIEFTITGGILGAFAVVANTCGASMAANSSCQLSINFLASAPPSSVSATLNITDSANNSPQTVMLTGTIE